MKDKSFFKVEHQLLDNTVLKPVEKCLLMLLRRLRTAPRGCTPSHSYLMKRTSIKHRKTLVRHLDKLQLFGYITWQNRGKNQTNKYYFREDSQFQSILQSNLRLRSKMSLQQKQLYNDRKLLKGINNKKVILIESLKK
jgi:hypothetical protein